MENCGRAPNAFFKDGENDGKIVGNRRGVDGGGFECHSARNPHDLARGSRRKGNANPMVCE